MIPPEANAEFVCQMEDILELYTRPDDPDYPLVCFDESSKQLISEVKKPLREGEENEASKPTQKPVFDIGAQVRGFVDGVEEIGRVCDRRYSPYDKSWLYRVGLVDGCKVYMFEGMLKEVPEADVLTVVDAAIKLKTPACSEASVAPPLFEIGQDVEGVIDDVLEIGLVCDRHYSEADKTWLYKVELADDCRVFMYEHMLQRPIHDEEVSHDAVDVIALVDEAIQEAEPFWVPDCDIPAKIWQRRLMKAQTMSVDIALKLYNCHPRELIAQIWSLLTEGVQWYYHNLFSNPGTAIS